MWYPADPGAQTGHSRDSYDLRDWLPAPIAARLPPGFASVTTGAYRDIPASSSGPFPLVLFVHGLYSFRDQSTFLTSWLASWGFVVAAPDLPAHDLTEFFTNLAGTPPEGPGDMEVLVDTENLVTAQDTEPGSLLDHVVRSGAVAVTGHSLGGLDAIEFASQQQVATYIALAAGFSGNLPALPDKPSLFMTGDDDTAILPGWVQATYAAASDPKAIVSISNAGHLAYTDLCQVAQGHGGLVAVGKMIGIDLPPGSPFTSSADDGCGTGFIAPQDSMALVRQFVVAQLTWALKGGASPYRPGGIVPDSLGAAHYRYQLAP